MENDIKTLKAFLSQDLTKADAVFELFQKIDGAKLFEGKREGDRFLFKKGTRDDRVTLVAHADTVFIGGTKQTIASKIVNGQEIISGTNPNVGIGADDRAGCAILWLLQNSGHNLLVLDGEETGCTGARYLMREQPDIKAEIEKSRFCLEFDRRGKDDYKCYEIPVPDKFKRYIEQKTGYKDAGNTSITDISVLCENICGVNFSVGYYNEHMPSESINVNEWLNTLNLTRGMLSEKIPQFSLDEQVRERMRKEKEERWSLSKNYIYTDYDSVDWEEWLNNYRTGKVVAQKEKPKGFKSLFRNPWEKDKDE